MRPRTILACVFAGSGTIQAIFGVFQAVAGIAMAPLVHPSWSRVAVLALAFLPIVGGIMFILLARPLGAFTARLAGVADEARLECQITAPALLNLVLAAIGIYVSITEGGAMIRLSILSYERPTDGGSVVGVSPLIPDAAHIIAHGIVVLLAVALTLKSGQIARALIGKIDDA